jgi:hypothetical protein
MPQSGKNLPKQQGIEPEDEMGPRIVESADRLPTHGMSADQIREAVRRLMANREAQAK